MDTCKIGWPGHTATAHKHENQIKWKIQELCLNGIFREKRFENIAMQKNIDIRIYIYRCFQIFSCIA